MVNNNNIITNMTNNINELNRLKENFKQELIKIWRQIDNNDKKSAVELMANAELSIENTKLKLENTKLKNEKEELRKTLLAELAADVHGTYKKIIEEKEEENKKLEEKVISLSRDYLQLNDKEEAVKKELENKKHFIENLQKEIQTLKEEVITERENFYDFADRAQAWREWQLKEKLVNQKERLIYLYEKPLPALPSKLKGWKKKLVNKIKQVIHYKKKKQETQYIDIAQIEIRK